MAAPKVDARHRTVARDPVGQQSGGIGALCLALDGDAYLTAAVVAGDMGFVRPEVRQQDRGIVQPGARGKAGQIKGKDRIGQIGQDQQRDGKGQTAAAAKRPLI